MPHFRKARDIRVGVIGYGGSFSMGRNHLNEMKAAGMTPTAVCEIDKSRLAVAKQEFPGIETYSSMAAMLKRSSVNFVTIITPHSTHAKLALQCLRSGRHVVCEKPLAVTTAECDGMIATAKKSKVVLSTYHNRHWDGCIMQAVKTIKAGAIGDIVRIEAHMGNYKPPGDWWRGSKSLSGGILYDWGVHMLEYSLQLITADISEVTGFSRQGFWKTRWKKDAIEDEATAVVRFASGQWLNLTASSLSSHPRPGVLEIFGTKGTYIMGLTSWELIRPREGGKKVAESGPSPADRWGRYYKNIANHLTRDTALVITPEWSRRPIHIIDLAGRSSRTGKTLKAKYK